MNEKKLRQMVSRQNQMNFLIGVGLLLGALFAWGITLGVVFWLGGLFQYSMIFLFSENTFTRWLPALFTVLLMLIIAGAGFTRQHQFLDLSGWSESGANLGRVGHSKNAPLMTHGLNRTTAYGYLVVEILLVAPIATREAIAMLRTRMVVGDETIAQAAEIHRDLKERADWVPRGRYHKKLRAVALLRQLQLIRQTDIRGIPSIRTPSSENGEEPVQ